MIDIPSNGFQNGQSIYSIIISVNRFPKQVRE